VPSGGYSCLKDVFAPRQPKARSAMDEMPSYWMAETLKYIWLTFNDGAVPLDRYVFSTEAHPMPVCPLNAWSRLRLALGWSVQSSC
jgi:mannosyl-oligosaccharide alpha-1,2-mannosidase